MARCKNSYSLPIERKYLTHWHKRGSTAHVGRLKHSIDFCALEGTPIRATFEGTVVWLKKDSKVGGTSKEYYNEGNRIVIKHKNGEYTGYEHMKYGGVKVKLRQKVKKGQLIGKVGMTGFGNAPHLHFEVFNNPDSDQSEGETLQVNFKDLQRPHSKCIPGKKSPCILA